MYECTYMLVCITYVCISVCMSVCKYNVFICMYVCMFAYVCVYPQQHLPPTELEHGPCCDADADEVAANATWFKGKETYIQSL